MKAVFIHRSGPSAASYRYRAEIPAREIGGTVNGGEANVLIFSKPTPDDLALAKESKAEGIKIVVDFCDDHFTSPTWGPIYQEMVLLSDALVANTPVMADRIKAHTNRTVDTIIADPYEEPHSEPHANSAARYLWFGNPVNLKDLSPWMEHLKNLDLTVLTGANPHWKHDFLNWTPAKQTEQLQRANVVLLPTRKGAEYKSANRMVNAIRAGCFVVAMAHPAHREFRDVAWVGDFTTGLKWTHYFKDELNDRVRAGQQYIERFSPKSIGAQWQQVIEALCV